MERIDPFSFFDFGKTLRGLTDISGEVATKKAFWPLYQADRAIADLLNGKPIPITVSSAKARAVAERISGIMDSHFRAKDDTGVSRIKFPDEKDSPIPSWIWDFLNDAVKEFETVFAEEMRETATYFVPRRGIYYTPALVDAADETFPPELLPFISEKAKADWKSAGRCLAFNLLSASGFHVARAVEGQLESYYQLFSGKNGHTLHGWHEYIQALETIAKKEPTPCPSAKTLAELDQMRKDYRNPIVHPRVVLKISDARMLFANGESLIIAMAQELAEISQNGLQQSLNLVGGEIKDDMKDAKDGSEPTE